MLKVTPYEYQQEGIAFGLGRKRIIIGDEPGLGKTLQSIAIVDKADAFPCLVICPSSLKINWMREFHKFTDRSAIVLDNSTATTWPFLLSRRVHDVAVVNYESLRKYFVYSAPSGTFRLKDIVFNPHISVFRSVIIDESHRIKEPTSHQTMYAKGISSGKEYVILLSGTPVVNRPADLITQLSVMDRLKEFGCKAEFLRRYGGGDGTRSARNSEDDTPRNLDELSRRLYESCMIRREKAMVLRELPEKTRMDVVVDISNREEYDTAEDDLREYLVKYTECTDFDIRRKMRMEALVKFMTLRSLSSIGKVRQAIDFARTFLESGKKLIIFCSLHDVVDSLHDALEGSVTVTGRDSMNDKQAAVDAFQNGNTLCIICSIKAAGVGLTLTASSNVLFVEFPWTYADCCQCEDRAHRIGQKDNVTCYYLLGAGTIDYRLYGIIQDKRSVANTIMASSDEIPTSTEYFDELVNAFTDET